MECSKKWFKSLNSIAIKHELTDIWFKNSREVIGFGLSSQKDLSKEFGGTLQSDKEFSLFLRRICYERRLKLDYRHPFSSASFEFGRFTVVLDELTYSGDQLFVRFSNPNNCLIEFEDSEGYLNIMYENFEKFHWLICGASGAGKSTLLKKIIELKYQQERLVVFERYKELDLKVPNYISLNEMIPDTKDNASVDLAKLVEIGLRLNSSKFVFGEIRMEEFDVFSQVALSGHGQVLSTFHSDCHNSMIKRLGILNSRGLSEIKNSLASVTVKRDKDKFYITSVHLPRA